MSARHIIVTDTVNVHIYTATKTKKSLAEILQTTDLLQRTDFYTELEDQILVGKSGTKLYNIVAAEGEKWEMDSGEWVSTHVTA